MAGDGTRVAGFVGDEEAEEEGEEEVDEEVVDHEVVDHEEVEKAEEGPGCPRILHPHSAPIRRPPPVAVGNRWRRAEGVGGDSRTRSFAMAIRELMAKPVQPRQPIAGSR